MPVGEKAEELARKLIDNRLAEVREELEKLSSLEAARITAEVMDMLRKQTDEQAKFLRALERWIEW